MAARGGPALLGMRILLCAALAGVLTFPGTWRQARADAAGTLVLSGRVCAQADGTPIPGAQVGIAGQWATAGADGSYQVTLPASAYLLVRATAPGFQSSDVLTLYGTNGTVLAGPVAFSFCGSQGLIGAFKAADGSVRLEHIDQLQPGNAHTVLVSGAATIALEANAALQRPDGGVTMIPIQRRGVALSLPVPLRAGAGRYVLEINAAAGFALIKLPLFVGGYQPPPAPPPYQADPAGAGVAELRAAALADLNAARGQAGLPPLRENPRLDGEAQAHSTDLARSGRISHYGTDGSSPGDRVQATGLAFRRLAEDVGGGPTVQTVVLGLLDSPAHRWAILGDFRLVGAGVARMDGGLVVTADFVR